MSLCATAAISLLITSERLHPKTPTETLHENRIKGREPRCGRSSPELVVVQRCLAHYIVVHVLVRAHGVPPFRRRRILHQLSVNMRTDLLKKEARWAVEGRYTERVLGDFPKRDSLPVGPRAVCRPGAQEAQHAPNLARTKHVSQRYRSNTGRGSCPQVRMLPQASPEGDLS